MTESERDIAAKVLRAMGNPVRLGVLESLHDGSKTVGELIQELKCSQSTMSQQIKILEYHGLIASRKEGTHKYCSLRNRDVLAMLDCIHRHLYTYLSQGSIGPIAIHPSEKDTL